MKTVEKMIHKNLKHFYSKIEKRLEAIDHVNYQRDSVYNHGSVSDPMGILNDDSFGMDMWIEYLRIWKHKN